MSIVSPSDSIVLLHRLGRRTARRCRTTAGILHPCPHSRAHPGQWRSSRARHRSQCGTGLSVSGQEGKGDWRGELPRKPVLLCPDSRAGRIALSRIVPCLVQATDTTSVESTDGSADSMIPFVSRACFVMCPASGLGNWLSTIHTTREAE
ncbi:hypothetical protein PENSPDRAFT_369855 [Peniophora sp. CONT]|nr:hypothetical protein PENSPDRAFT_369855 [Peniophora sp. CONT]